MDLKTMRWKLRHYTGLLEPRHIAAGKTWYTNAHVFCEAIADRTGLRLDQVAAVLAVTEAFRLEANLAGLRPCQLQAAAWCLIQEIARDESWEGTRPGSGIVVDDIAPF